MGRTVLNTTATVERPYVSKSRFLWGCQCRKLLWYAYNAKDQIPEPDAATQAIFDQGHEVGELAKSLYPGSIEVSAGVTDFEQVLQNSLETLKARKPLHTLPWRQLRAHGVALMLRERCGVRRPAAQFDACGVRNNFSGAFSRSRAGHVAAHT